jgi:predicted HTH domain antitoxin
MKSVNVSSLKNNPSEALRMAHEDMVLVMNRNEPDALMVGLTTSKLIDFPGVRKALATALFKEGDLSLARAAKLADLSLAEFISHASRLGYSVFEQSSNEVKKDLDTLEDWLKEA